MTVRLADAWDTMGPYNSRGLRAPYGSALHDSHPAACHGRWKVPGKHGETRSMYKSNWHIPNTRIWGLTSFNVRHIDRFIQIRKRQWTRQQQGDGRSTGQITDDFMTIQIGSFPVLAILLVHRQVKSSRAQDFTLSENRVVWYVNLTSR